MFNELLSLIQKEVVYSIYKVSLGIQMAPSIMQRGNMTFSGAAKEANGEKSHCREQQAQRRRRP